MKKCTRCGKTKALAEFSANKAAKDGLNYYCRPCHSLITKAYKSSHPEEMKVSAKLSRDKGREKRWAYQIQKDYGCTVENYNRMFTEQEGRCLGCNRHQSEFTQRLHVDHNHSTGLIRGLLCKGCNLTLGNAKDSIQTLESLIAYLKARA